MASPLAQRPRSWRQPVKSTVRTLSPSEMLPDAVRAYDAAVKSLSLAHPVERAPLAEKVERAYARLERISIQMEASS